MVFFWVGWGVTLDIIRKWLQNSKNSKMMTPTNRRSQMQTNFLIQTKFQKVFWQLQCNQVNTFDSSSRYLFIKKKQNKCWENFLDIPRVFNKWTLAWEYQTIHDIDLHLKKFSIINTWPTGSRAKLFNTLFRIFPL